MPARAQTEDARFKIIVDIESRLPQCVFGIVSHAMVSAEALSELLHTLYSAPLQPDNWQHFLTQVSQCTKSTSGFFISADTRSGLAVLAEGGPDPNHALVQDYNREYSKTDPFRTAVIRHSRRNNPVGVYAEDELVPAQVFLGSLLYCELLSPVDLRYAAISILALSVRRFDAISLWRTSDAGPVDSDTRRLLELLIPHVQTALETRRALGLTEQRLASAEAMANASATATFVLTKKGGIEHLNTAAEFLIRSNDGLTLTDGRVAARGVQANSSLERLFHEVSSPSFSVSKSQPNRFMSLERPSGKRPFQLIATPLPETHRQRSRADLLLLVTDPEKPASFPDDALHALYDLTPAETEVANGLLMGYSAEEIADLRRVSTGTVRQQVKSMLNKTGASRQSEMVRLFMTLPQAPMQTI